MALKSMKMDKKELKEQIRPSISDMPKFPFELRLHLDEDLLEKLNMDSLPDAGTRVTIEAVASVESITKRDTANNGKKNSMVLQITDMEVKPKSDKSAASKLFDNKS